MRMSIVALSIALLTHPAQAEDCGAKFRRIFTDRSAKGPVKIHVTQEIKGAKPTKNYNYQMGTGDWMSEMIEPANQPWSLVSKNVMYASTDKGKTWKKLRAFDSQQSQDGAAKQLKAAAATARNFACGEDRLNGVVHETVEAEYDYAIYKSQHHDKFWVNPKTGWISKSVTKTKQGTFESVATQLIEPAPDLRLPQPE